MYCANKDDREDLFQEIVLQLWRSYPSFKGEAKVSTWMYRKPLTRPLSVDHQNLKDTAEHRIDLEYATELQTAINLLNNFDKALVMLYLDEKSYKEIAEIMAITESNVGVKINRIKRKLQEIINL